MTRLLASSSAILCALTSVHAGTFLPEPAYIASSETLVGGAGRVNIVEVQVNVPSSLPGLPGDPLGGGGPALLIAPTFDTWVGYFVDVQAPGVTVDSFAISLNSLSEVISMQRGWFGTRILAEVWDSGTILPNGALSTNLGSYHTFFEEESPAVAFFWASPKVEGLPINEESDQDLAVQNDPNAIRFRLGSESTPNSNTLVFAPGGSVIDGSTIPEPSVALLGLTALGVMLRRRR